MSSGGSVVLVDHATEYLAPLDRPVERNDELVVVGWSLLAGLVREAEDPAESASIRKL